MTGKGESFEIDEKRSGRKRERALVKSERKVGMCVSYKESLSVNKKFRIVTRNIFQDNAVLLNG